MKRYFYFRFKMPLILSFQNACFIIDLNINFMRKFNFRSVAVLAKFNKWTWRTKLWSPPRGIYLLTHFFRKFHKWITEKKKFGKKNFMGPIQFLFSFFLLHGFRKNLKPCFNHPEPRSPSPSVLVDILVFAHLKKKDKK